MKLLPLFCLGIMIPFCNLLAVPIAAEPAVEAAAPPWALSLGHRAGVSQVIFAADSKLLASAGEDGSLMLRAADTGRLLRILKHPAGKSLTCTAFALGGKVLAAGTRDGSVVVWNTDTGAVLRTLAAPTIPDTERATLAQQRLVFSSDGTLVAFANGAQIKIWRWKEGAELRLLTLDESKTLVFCFSADSSRLLVAAGSRGLLSYSVQDNAVPERTDVKVAGTPIAGTPVAVSPEGRLWAFQSGRQVYLWNMERGEVTATLMSPGDLQALTFSGDGRRLLSAVSPALLLVWSSDKGQIVQALETGTELHPTQVSSLALSADGRRLAAASRQGLVRLWDAGTRAQVANLPAFTISAEKVLATKLPGVRGPAGALLSSYSDGTLRVWDVGSGQLLRSLPHPNRAINAVAISPDAGTLALCLGWSSYSHSMDTQGVAFQDVQLLDTTSWQPRVTIRIESHWDSLSSLTFSPDGKTLAAGSRTASFEDGIRLWDVSSGKPLPSLFQPSQRLEPAVIAFSPDGNKLASRSDSGHGIQIFDLKNDGANLIKNQHGAPYAARGLSFLPDNDTLVVVSERGIHRWSVAASQWLESPEKVAEPASELALAPGGQMLASRTDRGSIKLWDVPSFRFRGYLSQNRQEAREMAFTLDNRLLALASPDGSLRLWRVDTPRQVAAFQVLPSAAGGGEAWISSSPDGHYIGSKEALPWMMWSPPAGKSAEVLQAELKSESALRVALQGP